jgi:hypothetical protein
MTAHATEDVTVARDSGPAPNRSAAFVPVPILGGMWVSGPEGQGVRAEAGFLPHGGSMVPDED